jgi:hypothetical protein
VSKNSSNQSISTSSANAANELCLPPKTTASMALQSFYLPPTLELFLVACRKNNEEKR